MAKVESFTLDHTKVKAPYVRLITVEEGPKGDKIANCGWSNQTKTPSQRRACTRLNTSWLASCGTAWTG